MMERMYQIWQWGSLLYCGTKQECETLKERWETKCGNIELEIIPV
jgi:hypothetical protein